MHIFSSTADREKRKQEKSDLQAKVEEMVVTTADLKNEYELVTVLKAETLSDLKLKAAQKGANALVGVGFFGYDEQCYGTAVRLISPDERIADQKVERAESSETAPAEKTPSIPVE